MRAVQAKSSKTGAILLLISTDREHLWLAFEADFVSA
jgi:hypothetical protein